MAERAVLEVCGGVLDGPEHHSSSESAASGSL